MPSFDDLTFREANSDDGERILRLFNRVFAAVDPEFRERGPDLWRWRYLDCPDGAQVFLALDGAGEVQAQYAASCSRWRHAGLVLASCQAIDSMVAPERRGLGRAGLFVETGRLFAEHFGGEGAERSEFMWGLPVQAALRIGRARLGYELIGGPFELSAELERLPGAARPEFEVERVERFPEELDAFDARVAPGVADLSVRDAAWLNWRYAERPGHDHRIALVRAGAELAGWCVLSPRGRLDPERLFVLDWMFDPDRAGALECALAWAGGEARSVGARLLSTWMRAEPAWGVERDVSEWFAWQEAGFRVGDSAGFTVLRSFSERADLDALHRRLQLRPGDTDIF